MTLGRSRPTPAHPRTRGGGHRGELFTVTALTQHWRRIGGRWYRDAVVTLPDGTRRLYALPDTTTEAAA